MHVSIPSFIPALHLLLPFFFYYLFPFHTSTVACLFTFVTSAGVFKNELCMDVLLACFLLLFLSIPYFSNGVFIYVCYTSQLKYVFRLEENGITWNSQTPWGEQNSLTP